MKMEHVGSERRRQKRVAILRVVNPCSFWIKYDIKADIEHAVNSHYSQHNIGSLQLHNLRKNMNVVVYFKRKSMWCRARVLGFDKCAVQQMIVVRLIDRGCKESVSIDQIRIALEHFMKAAPLAFQLFLPGIRPLTLQMMPDVTFEMRKSLQWDPSAKQHVENLAMNYKASVEIMDRNKEEQMLGKLLFQTPDGIIELNENLVTKKYAVFDVQDFEMDLSNFRSGSEIFSQSNLTVERVCNLSPPISAVEKVASWCASGSNSVEERELNVHPPVKLIIPNIYLQPAVEVKNVKPPEQPSIDRPHQQPEAPLHRVTRQVVETTPNMYPAGMLLCHVPMNSTMPRRAAVVPCDQSADSGLALPIPPSSAVPDIAVPKTRDSTRPKREAIECSQEPKPSAARKQWPKYFSQSLPEHEEDDDGFGFVLEYRKLYGKKGTAVRKEHVLNEYPKCTRNDDDGERCGNASRQPVRQISAVSNARLVPLQPWQTGVIPNTLHQGKTNIDLYSRPSYSPYADASSSGYKRNECPALPPPSHTAENVPKMKHAMRGLQSSPTTKPMIGYGRGHWLPPKPAGVICSMPTELETISKARNSQHLHSNIPFLNDGTVSAASGSTSKDASVLQQEKDTLHKSAQFPHGTSREKPAKSSNVLRLQKNPYYYAECPPAGSDDTRQPRGIEDRVTASRILICGENANLNKFTSLSGLSCKLLIQNLEKLNVFWPNTLQSHVWPAIKAKCNIATICSKSTGKTIAYLAPLLANLMGKKMGNDTEDTASSPTIVILASSWRQALQIYSQCTTLLTGCSFCRAAVIYGGGSEDTQKAAVLNGCDILVSTPPALVRLLQCTKSPAIFSLSNLRCIAFDDVNALIVHYMAEIRDIFSDFTRSMKSHANALGTRRQILAFGTHWTPAFQQFVHNFIPKPVFLCTSLLEAAVYSGVNIIPHCVTSHDTLRFFLDTFLPQFRAGLTKTVIFTTEIDDAIAIANALDHCCHVLLAHHGLDFHSIADVSRHWYNRVAVLVITDTCWPELDVVDAECLIHYDIPKLAKGLFADRFSCLLDQMQNYGVYSQFEEKDAKPSCKVHLLLTEECKTQAQALYLLLARLVTDIPPMLEEVLINYYLDREANKDSVPLCDSIKAFGKCYNILNCTQRHMIINSIDKPTLSMRSNSLVKIEVSHIKNATHYYGRLIEFIDQSGQKVKRPSVDTEFLNDLKNLLKPERKIPCDGSPKEGDMYAYVTADGTVHRVLVANITESDNIDVIHVDKGNAGIVKVENLIQLPAELKAIPPLVHEVFACNLCPWDKDCEWTANANKHVSDLMSSALITGNVNWALGNTLWLHPIENRVYLSSVKTEVCKWNLHKELVGKFADINDTHIKDIIELCGSIVVDNVAVDNKTSDVVVEKIEDTPGLFMLNQWAYLGDGKVDVVVSAVQSPAKFFVLKTELKQCLEALLKDISSDHANTSCGELESAELKENMIFMAKCPSDELWHRAQLIKDVKEGTGTDKEEVKVRFVDVGHECIMKMGVLKRLNKTFLWRLPFQAIQCSLDGIVSCDDEWSCEASAAFWNMTKDENGHPKALTVKVVSKCPSEIVPNVNCYAVQLFDGNILLNEEICKMGYGKQKMKEILDNREVNGLEKKALTHSLLELQQLKCEISTEENKIDKTMDERIKPLLKSDSVQPHVIWSDTKDQIKITIFVPGVKTYTLSIDEKYISFKTVVNHVMNASHFVTYRKVVPNSKKVLIKDTSVVIILKKDETGNWPRLLHDNQKFSWIKFDYDAIGEDSSDDELQKDLVKVPEGYNADVLNGSENSDDEDEVALDTDEENDLFDI